MLILPLVYVALTVAAGWGVYYFALHCVPAIWDWNIRFNKVAIVVKFVCMVTPLVVGSSIALFMVKPIFAPRLRRSRSAVLDSDTAPRVSKLVQDVCQSVGAPAPVRIELDCEVNASARFDGGWRGFVCNRLILRLGLPLVAGLTQRELAGVIAHEFGHFRQGAGLRFSYVIHSVNGWFARVIYQRDRWDETVEALTESESGWVSFMSLCATLGIAVSRGVLWVLMMIGHAVSAFLMRQMEYDADAAEIHLAGSDAFKTTTEKLAAMNLVNSGIRQDMQQMWQHRRQLPDNLPALIEDRESRLPPAARAALRHALEQAKTGWLDTHPSSRDRVRAAERLSETGLQISDAPARELFTDFAEMSRSITLSHYQHDLGLPTSSDFLFPVALLIAPTPPERPSDATAAAPALATIPFNF